MKARRYAYIFPLHKAVALVSPFFVKGSEMSSKERHILMHIMHWLLLHLFSFLADGDKMPSKIHHI